MNEKSLDAIARSAALPSMPQVVARFLEVSADPDADVKDIVAILATDPGIASELLRLSNSALFGVTRPITSLQQAVALLGLHRVRSLVLGRYMAERVAAGAAVPGDFSFSYFWRRSLGTAVLAAEFANRIAPEQRQDAFIGGLLADVGVVVLFQALFDAYAPIGADYAPLRGDDLIEREHRAFGFTHADVSALVLEKWMLPSDLVEAVRLHHADNLPGAEDDPVHVLARILDGAGRIAKLLCENPAGNTVAPICVDAMKTVGLDSAALPEILRNTEQAIREFASLLRMDVIESKIYGRIAELIGEALQAPLDSVCEQA